MLDKELLEEVMRRYFFRMLESEVPKFIRKYEEKRKDIIEQRRKNSLELDKKKLIQGLTRGGRVRQWYDAYDRDELRRKKKAEEDRAKLKSDVANMSKSDKQAIINAFAKRGK